MVLCSDDTVEVGADLYELDTEAEATTTAAAPKEDSSSQVDAKSETPASPAPTQASVPAPAAATKAARVPSIKFLGKDGWMRVRAGVPELPPVPPNFGRPVFSEEEMEALMTGGANLVPEVKDFSAGAVFA